MVENIATSACVAQENATWMVSMDYWWKSGSETILKTVRCQPNCVSLCMGNMFSHSKNRWFSTNLKFRGGFEPNLPRQNVHWYHKIISRFCSKTYLIIAFAVLIKDSPILLCEIINRPTLILKFLIFFISNQLLNNFLIYFSIGLINFSCRLANISVAL